MKNLTEKQREILLNLLLWELQNIHKQNGNINPLLEGYKEELSRIYQAICDSMED